MISQIINRQTDNNKEFVRDFGIGVKGTIGVDFS